LTEPRKFTDLDLQARGYTRRASFVRVCRGCKNIVECWQDRDGRNAGMVRDDYRLKTDMLWLTPHHSICREPIRFGFGREEKTKGKKWEE
jgi:hypothetical protein